MGPEPGGTGNLVITGHNYKSGAHFGKLDEVKTGDTVLLTDKSGNTYTYTVLQDGTDQNRTTRRRSTKRPMSGNSRW